MDRSRSSTRNCGASEVTRGLVWLVIDSSPLKEALDRLQLGADRVLRYPDPVQCEKRPNTGGHRNEPERREHQDDKKFGTHSSRSFLLAASCVSRAPHLSSRAT